MCDEGGYTILTVSVIYFCTITIPITITYKHTIKCTIKCDCYSYTLSAPTHGEKNFNSFNSTCSLTTSHQKSQTRTSPNICFLKATFTYHLASYFIAKDYNYQHSIYILVVLQEKAEMGGDIYTHTHTYIYVTKSHVQGKYAAYLCQHTDRPVYLKIPNLFHRGTCNIYLHSPYNTNGIT
jgi:hypothetical protein